MTSIEIPDELAQHLQLRAQQLHISFEQLVISTLQKSLYPKHGCFLNAEQFEYMREHHVELMQALADKERADISADVTLNHRAKMVIEKIMSSERYKQLFGEMDFDSLLDSYEDTPGYDNSLKIQLLNQLNRDLAEGRLKEATTSLSRQAVLEKLNKMRRDE